MVSLLLFGFPCVVRDGAAIDIKRRKVTGLLAYLAVTGQRHGRDALAEMLFPEQQRDRPRADLSNTLSNLARAIGNGFLRVDRDSVWLPPSSGLSVDVHDFRRLAALAGNPGSKGRGDEALRALGSAVCLVRDAFLAGFSLKDSPGFDEWQRSEQERLRLEHARVLERLADILEARREFEKAISFAEKRLALDDFDEPSHRRLMRLLLLAGHRGEALEHYQRCASALRRELGAEPEPETEKLHRQILQGAAESRSRAPRAHTSARGNLPTPVNPLIGRESEFAAATAILMQPDVRLLTLVGPGGTGKTRLALQIAEEMRDRFPHGVFFVDLAQLRETEAVLPAIASVLRVHECVQGNRSVSEILREFLAGRRVLLLLDNFEHLVPAAAGVAALLGACPEVKVLATSREPLNLLAERLFRVRPLGLDEGSLEAIKRCASVRLFVQRATAACPDFAVDDSSAPVVAAICSRLDGMPLAIELAAARIRTLSPRALLERLDHRLALLSGGPLDLPTRQRSLRGEIDWSHELLDRKQQQLFRRLAVFTGGCTVESAAAVCFDEGNGSACAALDSLLALQDKSLLEARDSAVGPRFHMLQTIREYAMERLERCGETGTVRRRLACWCRELAETAEPLLYGPEQRRWFEQLEVEHANIGSSLEWLHAQGEVEQGLRLAGAMGWFWFRRARFVEGQRWLEALRGLSGDRDAPGPRARVLYYLGWMRSVAGRHSFQDPGIVESFAECVDRCPPDFDGRYRAASTAWIAGARRQEGSAAANVAQRSIALARQSGDSWAIAFCLVLANQIDDSRGLEADDREAERALEEAVAHARLTGDPFIICRALHAIGSLHSAHHRLAEAESRHLEALAIARECGDFSSIMMAALGLSDVLHRTGRPLETKGLYLDTLRMASDAGTRSYYGCLLGGLCWVAIAEGRPVRAARLWGASMAAAVSAEGCPAELPSRLGLEKNTGWAAWSLGHAMSIREAVEYALSDA